MAGLHFLRKSLNGYQNWAYSGCSRLRWSTFWGWTRWASVAISPYYSGAWNFEDGFECFFQSADLCLQFACRANNANFCTTEPVHDNLTKLPAGSPPRVFDPKWIFDQAFSSSPFWMSYYQLVGLSQFSEVRKWMVDVLPRLPTHRFVLIIKLKGNSHLSWISELP